MAKEPARPMGIGKLGFPNLSIKRKFRYTLTIEPNCRKGVLLPIGESFVKSASRPNFDIEETELNFLNGKTWIAGKVSWQEMTVTYMDTSSNETAALYRWIGQSAPMSPDKNNMWQGTSFKDYAATATLRLYSGCGDVMEQWTLSNVWPKAANFGELDNTSSEEATIELTLRYDQVVYVGFCPEVIFDPCCSPCETI
jgi:hypothetical protein